MLKSRHTAEKRQFGRRQAFVNAWLVVRGRAPVACTVVNISEGGALIELREHVVLPYAFILRFDSGAEMSCEVRHQHEQRVGVEFVVRNARTLERPSPSELASWKSAGHAPTRPPQR